MPGSGLIWRQPSMRTAWLAQDATLSANRPVFDVVAEGLGDTQEETNRTKVRLRQVRRDMVMENK
jgi:ATPase subunit of ABC transporter with duplicated ATPase domains